MMTPLGSAVEPEVYWSNARVLQVTAGSRHSWARPPVTLSVANQRIFCNSGACLNRPSVLERIADVVSTTEGCASLMMARSLGRVRCDCAGLGGGRGTAITPAYKQPKNAAMNSRPAG